LDFAVFLPYFGKEVRIPELLKEIGFREGFNPDGSLKDLQQAAAVARNIITEKKEQKRVSKIMASIPDGWKKRVFKGIEVGIRKLPLEENTCFALKKLLLTLQQSR